MIGNWQPFNSFAQLLNMAFGQSDYEHEQISQKKALSFPAVWYGVSKIAGHIGQLPIGVYRRLDRGAERNRGHEVERVLRRPNVYQTPVVFKEQIAVHSILQGNGRAAIVRDNRGVAVELIPLLPENSATGMLGGEKIHASRPAKDDRLRMFFPTTSGKPDDLTGTIMLLDSDVIHIPGLTLDGVSGLPLIEAARRNLLISVNTEKRLSNQMTSGFQGNILLEAPPGVFPKQKDAEEFLDAFERRHHDPDKSGKPGLLREGIKANILAMNNKDAEFIEQRKFQRQDAALWLGLESILGDDSSVSYNSLEQKNLAYLMNTLNKWLKRWEEELEFKLFRRAEWEQNRSFIRFNTAALLKSDYETSIRALSQAITATIISPNEAREKLDMNPYPGGDVFANPAITPGSQADPEDDEPEEDATDDDGVMQRIDRLTRHEIARFIGFEAKKVSDAAKSAAKNGKNFIAWMDDFYDSNWQSQMCDMLSRLGISESHAQMHCNESRRRLLDVCGASTQETLPQNVAKCVENWKDRADLIGDLRNV